MKVIVDLCVVPLGVGVSVSRYVAACERILAEAGLKIKCILMELTSRESGMRSFWR